MSASRISRSVVRFRRHQFSTFAYGKKLLGLGTKTQVAHSDFDVRSAYQFWFGMILASLDILIVGGALLITNLGLGDNGRLQELIILAWAVLIGIIAQSVGQYSVTSRYSVLRDCYTSLWIGVMLLIGACYATYIAVPLRQQHVMPIHIAVTIFLFTLLMVASRLFLFIVLGLFRDRFIERIMLVAKPGAIVHVAKDHTPPAQYCNITCCLSIDSGAKSAFGTEPDKHCLGNRISAPLHSMIKDHPIGSASFLASGVDRIIILSQGFAQADINYVGRLLEHLPLEITVTSGMAFATEPDRWLSRTNCLVLRHSAMTYLEIVSKRVFDIIMSVLLLLFLLPVLIVIAIVIKLESPGPAIFRQPRWGWNHEIFTVYKFRTMWVNADRSRQALRNDNRVTPFGSFLRRTSLDEIPQLLNVLGGSMSLVGPRPHPVDLNERFRHLIDRYCVRHRVIPGLTGWAQVNGSRGATETREAMENRVKFDLEYIQMRSFAFDLWILARTAVSVISGKNAY